MLGLGDALRRARIAVFGPSSGAALRRGLEGVLQGADAGGRRADGARLTCTRRRVGAPRRRRARRRLRRQGRRARGRQGRRRLPGPRARHWPRSRRCLVGGAFGDAGAHASSSRSCSTATRSRCSRSATARRRVPLAPPRRTSSASATATRAQHRRHGRLLAGAVVRRRGRPEARRDRCTSRCWPSCARRGTPFSGCLYAGLMLTADGPRVLEYNVRFGDPETQALVARLDGDLRRGARGDRARRARRRRARRRATMRP